MSLILMFVLIKTILIRFFLSSFLFLLIVVVVCMNKSISMFPVRNQRIPTNRATRTPRTRSHYPDDSPSFYRRDFQGGLNRAPVSGHSMEFLRGIYAFMQVSRSSVSVQNSFKIIIIFLCIFYDLSVHIVRSASQVRNKWQV